MAKLNMEINEAFTMQMDALKRKLKIENTNELFNLALTFLTWGVEETEKNNLVASYNPDTDSVEAVSIPGFKKIIQKPTLTLVEDT